MFTQIPGPDQHFSAYYEDNSILIQFIMVEFVQTYQLTLQIKKLIQENLDSPQISSELFPSLIQILGQLTGCLSQHERSAFSRWTKGSLTKFKEHCEQFSRNSSHQNKQHVSLHMAAHHAWLTAIHNFELLNSLYTNPYTQNPKTLLHLFPLKRSFHILQNRINQIIRYIPHVMNDYWNNENVILCLLRKRAQFTEIYGSDFLYKRFKWPVKIKELIQLLVLRYQARGFEALLPTIQQILDSEAMLYDTY